MKSERRVGSPDGGLGKERQMETKTVVAARWHNQGCFTLVLRQIVFEGRPRWAASRVT